MLEESEKIGGPGIYVEIDQFPKRTQQQNHSKFTCNQNLIVNFMQFYFKNKYKLTEKVSSRKKNLS